MIKFRGINYNAGIEYDSSIIRSNKIDLDRLKKDLQLIKKINCNAIRMYGTHIDKLILYSDEALKQGFCVWISPRLIDGNRKETIKFVREASKKSEALRKEHENVIFIVGNELLIDSTAIFSAPRTFERVESLKSYIKFKLSVRNEIPRQKQKFLEKTDNSIKEFVDDLREEVRGRFKGEITYASLPWEKIDWSGFDVVAVNLYKNQWNASTYIDELRRFKSFRKPLAITEFGTCAYRGASELGGSAYDVIDYHTKTVKKGIVRDENEQTVYLKELIELYNKENVFAAFIFDFKEEWKTYSKNHRKDLDLSSFGIVKVLENGNVVPKKAFNVVRKLYLG